MSCPYSGVVCTYMEKDARLEVRVPRELLERLPTGRQRSEFVRRAVEQALGPSSERAAPDSRAQTTGTGSVTPATAELSEKPAEVPERQKPDLGEWAVAHVEAVDAAMAPKPTAQQLAGKNGVPLSVAVRWLNSGEWVEHWG